MKLQKFILSPPNDYEIAAVYSKGSGDLLFCIHGLGCSHNSFRSLEGQSELKDYSFLAVDLFGFGNSGRSDEFSYSMEDHAEICAALLQQFSYERLHLLAHSMGGAIALLLPPNILDSVESFANIEGNLIAADCGIASRRARQRCRSINFNPRFSLNSNSNLLNTHLSI